MLDKYLPRDTDGWSWTLAQISDIKDLVDLSYSMYNNEIDTIFTTDLGLLARNIAQGIITQTYNPLDEQIICARDTAGRMIAWAWMERGGYVTYAPEEIAEAKFAHVALDLSPRKRITLLAQILQQWELWATICNVPVIVSTTIRRDQTAFLHLHEQAGYEIRGSFGYKRIL